MRCPTCGGETRVTNTGCSVEEQLKDAISQDENGPEPLDIRRKIPLSVLEVMPLPNYRWRKRVCLKCGLIHQTTEITLEDWKRIMEGMSRVEMSRMLDGWKP